MGVPPSTEMSDDDVLANVRADALAGQPVGQYLLNNRWSASEVRGYHLLMNWIPQQGPTKTWETVKQGFAQFVATRTEADLIGLFRALGKEAPGMPVLKLMPKRR